ncbi:MAG TPA: alpha/beta hydrolase [Streptosporangiaceae bacterium]|nr:alpha/beta hydrolase [Streptosporangiaceae bacterium]
MQLQELDAARRSVTTRSGEISYIDLGTGPAALFVHGIATNAYLWRNVIAPLASQRRCVALDLPLHGRSPVADGQDLSLSALAAVVEDFCDALGLTGIDLVANDTGGAIAQIFAARNPHRLATLTLTNCDTSGNTPPEAFKPVVELAAAGQLAPTAVAMLADPGAAAKVAFGSGYEHLERIDPAVIRSYLEPWCGTIERARHFERLLAALDDGDLAAVTPRLRELTVPTLLVWGTGDEFFDASWARWLRDTIPGTTGLITVDGARLFFPDERPMDLVPHLEKHWAAAANPLRPPAVAGRA